MYTVYIYIPAARSTVIIGAPAPHAANRVLNVLQIGFQVTLVEDHAGSVSNGQSPATVDMYLHQNFKSCLHYLQHAGHDLLAPGRKVRLTG